MEYINPSLGYDAMLKNDGSGEFKPPCSRIECTDKPLFSSARYADFFEGFEPKAKSMFYKEEFVVMKNGPDSFIGTNLDDVLQANGIKTVILTGLETNVSVESTMRTAYEKGYNVITVPEMMAAQDQAVHDEVTSEHGSFSLFSHINSYKFIFYSILLPEPPSHKQDPRFDLGDIIRPEYAGPYGKAFDTLNKKDARETALIMIEFQNEFVSGKTAIEDAKPRLAAINAKLSTLGVEEISEDVYFQFKGAKLREKGETVDKPEETEELMEGEKKEDFIKGKLHGLVGPVMASTGMTENVQNAAKFVRDNGGKVIHIRFGSDSHGTENINPFYGICKGGAEDKLFMKNTWNFDYAPGFEPQDGDLETHVKNGLSGFLETNLEALLFEHGIKNVAIAGFLTNCCVESTMRDAYERKFNVITLTDAMAAGSDSAQKAATEHSFKLFSSPVTVDAFVKQLSAPQ